MDGDQLYTYIHQQHENLKIDVQVFYGLSANGILTVINSITTTWFLL